MFLTPFLHESPDGFAAAGRNGSSEEWHRRCLGDEWFRPLRSSASLPRKGESGNAETVPHAIAPWPAVRAGDLCNRVVRSARRASGKVFLPRQTDLMRLLRTGR